jgi:hypothetical protein
MPFVTFTVRRGLSAADKSRLSEAMLEAQVAAGYHRADRFHRFLEVDQDDLLVDLRFPDYATDRTDRFMVVEVIISSGRPTGTAATIADEAVRLFGERLHLAPQDILFVFYEVEPNLPRFPAASTRREIRPRMPKPPKRDQLLETTKELLWEVGYEAMSPRDIQARSAAKPGRSDGGGKAAL